MEAREKGAQRDIQDAGRFLAREPVHDREDERQAERRVDRAEDGLDVLVSKQPEEVEVQQDLDEMQREAERMNDCADGDCPERAPEPSAESDELLSAVPRR